MMVKSAPMGDTVSINLESLEAVANTCRCVLQSDNAHYLLLLLWFGGSGLEVRLLKNVESMSCMSLQ